MEEVRSALEEHFTQVADLVQKLSSELRSAFKPAYHNLIGFYHAIDWKEPCLVALLSFHFVLLLTAILSRKNLNFQMCLFILILSGVYLAERINSFLGHNWRKFATQNYFDPRGIFMSTLWSGPLLVIAIMILINTLFSVCYLIVRWKKAELRHRARLARNKED